VHTGTEDPAGTGLARGPARNAEACPGVLCAHPAGTTALRFELHRYLGVAGQATAYKLGRAGAGSLPGGSRGAGACAALSSSFHSRALAPAAWAWTSLLEASAQL